MCLKPHINPGLHQRSKANDEVECDLTIRFGVEGNSLAFLGGGWAQSEPVFTWSIGVESHVILPRTKPADEYMLTLDVVPFIHHPDLRGQRLIVLINDTIVGAAELSRPTLLAYRIPGSLARQSERMLVTLKHPDAAYPNKWPDSTDGRHLAFSVSEIKFYRMLGELKSGPAGRVDARCCKPVWSQRR